MTHSIVIPVHDHAELTRRCLDRLLELPECEQAEIVVVDDGSADATAGVVGSYGERVSLLREPVSRGFARACNAGARASRGEAIVFLNNDTVPHEGWLAALLDHAERTPAAAVIGSRLLYPNGTVQHAGIAICQDRFPRHLYAGFAADHPAVIRSRPMRAVSAACALVRRGPWEQAGGFDARYRNGLEDVDLCLRMGELGHEVHYCAESVLVHLESVSRGRRSQERAAAEKLYLSRWGDRVPADDVLYYLADGLIELRYEETYPLRARVSAELATLEDRGRERESNRLLAARSRQSYELLREAVRLSVVAAGEGRGLLDGWDRPSEAGAERAVADRARALPAPGAEVDELRSRLAEAHEELRRRDEELSIRLYELQAELSARAGAPAPSERLAYRRLPERLRALVGSCVPADRAVAVVSKGDEELLRLDGRPARHFPCTPEGEFPGHYPEDSAAAIAQLEQLLADGVAFLVFPEPALWWLEHYGEFASCLRSRHEEVARDAGAGVVYALRPAGARR